jgi:hypothetical protein
VTQKSHTSRQAVDCIDFFTCFFVANRTNISDFVKKRISPARSGKTDVSRANPNQGERRMFKRMLFTLTALLLLSGTAMARDIVFATDAT